MRRKANPHAGLLSGPTTYESSRYFHNKHEGSAWSELEDEDFLVQIGAADDENGLHPTAAGLLMFGTERRITKEYPEYFLDYREHMDPNIRWTDRVYSQESEWSGNVFDFYNRVSVKLLLDLKKPFKLVDQVRVDEMPQHDAVREALLNCLVNAEFYQAWSVVIEKYPDKIVIANSGTIITGKKQMLKGGISQPRNKGLFKMFNLIGLGEHAGSGVPDIYHAWREVGLEEPEVEEKFGNPDRTVLTLPLIQSETSVQSLGTGSAEATTEVKLKPDKLNKLLEFCAEPRSKQEMMDFCEIKTEKYFRENIVKPMLREGLIVRTIPEKPSSSKQKYIATKSNLERAQAILDNNPVLEYSLDDLRKEGRTVEEYLKKFGEAERKKYMEYYEDKV